MTNSFEGYPRRGLTFLRRLVTNNNRDWFHERREIYLEDVRAPTIAFVESMNVRLARWAPAYVAEPRHAVPRIARDVRFTEDKTPYKTAIAALFGHSGMRLFDSCGFSVRVSALGVRVGGGVFQPSTESLLAIRTALLERHGEFRRILKRKALVRWMGALEGRRLVHVPSGFPADHPAADLLRLRELYFETTLPLDLAASPSLVADVARRFRSMLAFVDFLADALGLPSTSETA